MKITFPLAKNGQSIVEFALLLPILLLLSVVVIDLGRGIYYYSEVYNAAREGARYAIVVQCRQDEPCADELQDLSGIQEAARKLAIGLNPLGVDANLNDTTIDVTVSYDFHLVTPLANLIIGSDHFSLHSTATMAIER